ncbi:MAG: gliding motility-associated C-terminal domain-containing protein [Crocinitomicaceae bacterium]|nr:gliding motility-associated C-terminal domain-containing protein [Crocinitomicaceae bacterium]
MYKILSIAKVLLIGFLFVFSQNALSCAVDVTIMEGSSLSICPNSTALVNASPGYAQYVWSGPATGNGSSATVTGSGWVYVAATDGLGCISIDSILVSTYPTPNPIISSSEGLTICPTVGGSTLSLNQTYNSYLWNDGSTNPMLFVTQSGQYTVVVEDANGCKDSAFLDVDFIQFTLNVIGGAKVCAGSTVVLNATGGDVYAWSTNEFSSSIVVAPTEESTYSVTIYKGACHQTLSATVKIIELPPHSMPDTMLVFPGEIPYVFGPSEFDSYLWAPSNLVSDTSGSRTGYVGTTDGTVMLVATSNSLGCSMGHTIFFKMIDLTIPEGFSPNGDGINDFFEIPEITQFEAKLKVWNRWGEVVFKSDKYRNEWDGTCSAGLCMGNDNLPEGTYYYKLTIGKYDYTGFLTLKI